MAPHVTPTPIAALLLMALTAGCEPAPPPSMGPPTAGLGGAFDPIYQVAPPGALVPASCLSRQASGYGPWPPRCVMDSAFATQLANPRDAIQPRPPGPPSAIPAGRAADAYIFGGESGPPSPPVSMTEPVVDTDVQ